MWLDGSCSCGAVRFGVEAYAPVPFTRCHCSICRKTAGGGGYAINLGAYKDTMTVEGEADIGVFHAVIDGKESEAERHFCLRCGSALWVFDPSWPDLVHPFASAIDTALPEPPQVVHMMLGSRASWVRDEARPGDASFDVYPDESLEDWHRRMGMLDARPTKRGG
ncbi:GFA family protein [Acuticoccus sp. M5D2P5]|uniref:GFA family protein n=1 Tax=Acuticoccus kalidii TaxID=2910977 RepID=UPI001F43F806|nr:GFA family protein [Acuticoccus kalidii]MCF3933003.1 GFA family protein [Acuticoccus kalidii]